MILNETYYHKLIDQYQSQTTLSSVFDDRVANLSLQMIMKNYYQGLPIHINFQNRADTIKEIGINLFIEFANDIYCNHYDLPTIMAGDEFKSKKEFHIGKAKPRKLRFKITPKSDGKYRLYNEKLAIEMTKTYDQLVQNFTPIKQNAQDKTLKKFETFFKKINSDQEIEFPPYYFDRKSVFIAKKGFWDALKEKSSIPTTYIPNPREESDVNLMKSIPALPDCIMYVTSKYEQCYQQILQQNKKVKTLVFLDTEEDRIQQVLQDKNRFGFNIIVLSNSANPIRHNQVPCWNWFNEEIEIVNAL